MDDITGSTGEPWRVTISRVGDGRVIHLHVGNVGLFLPALEAHKLGSALHAASGLDAEARGEDEMVRCGDCKQAYEVRRVCPWCGSDAGARTGETR